jgi:hypothetical protein
VSTPTIWSILGIAPTKDAKVIRRAYAEALKRTNPDDDQKAFALLRAAYERALRQALEIVRSEQPTRTTGAGASAAREPPPVSESSQDAARAPPPRDLDELRSAFATLQRVVTAEHAPAGEDMRAALAACLASPALSNVSLQLEFEAAMARFLLQTQPRTESLLATVIEHWNWRLRQRFAAGDGIATVVSLAENVELLERVRASSPRTYLAVTKPPRPSLLWAQIVAFRLDSAVRDLLARLRTDLPRSLNPQALAWWSECLTQPRPRPALIRFAGVLAGLGAAVGAFVGLYSGSYERVLSDAWKGGVAGLLAGLAVTGSILGLAEWPRYLLRTTRRIASPWVTLGWAPAGLLSCLIASVCPVTTATVVSAWVLSVAIVYWTVLMMPDNTKVTEDALLRRVGGALFANAAVVVWWALLTAAPEAAPTRTMWPVFSATLVAFAIGQPLLWGEFLGGLSRERRQWARFAIAAVAVGLVPVLLYMPVYSNWNGLLLACLFSVVLAHRTAAVDLTRPQAKVRYRVILGFALLFGVQRGDLSAGSALRDVGALFMAGVVCVMAQCLVNEPKSNPRAAPAAA